MNDNYVRGYIKDFKIKGLTKAKLLRIGNSVASLWGGSCCGYEIRKNDKVLEVIFDCIEFDEEFCTILTSDEIKKEYNEIFK